uniref:Uncharacterized protein n=1 Tax=Meloidogyne javanica TaxID=6303 RepID=A0A915LR75_MELJA
MNSKKPGLLALLPKPKGVSQTKTPELSSISALPKLGPSQTLEQIQQIEETMKTVEFKKINDKPVEPASKKIRLEGEDYDVLNEPQIFFEEVAPGLS